jgi:hypothetical protein
MQARRLLPSYSNDIFCYVDTYLRIGLERESIDYLDLQQDHQRGQELDTLVLYFFETLSQEDLTGSLGGEFIRTLVTAANRQRKQKQYESAMRSYQQTLKMLETVELDREQRTPSRISCN